MTRNQVLLIGALLVVLSACISAWYYPHLPAQIPIHWNAPGRITNYGPKLWAVLQMPIVLACMWVLLLVLPLISPKGYRLDPFLGAFGAVVIGLMAALLIQNVVVLRSALHGSTPPGGLVFFTVGAMLIILGNYMGKFRKNFFIGVRTPWTLASDEVWARTHRVAGWLYIVAGLVVMANVVFGAQLLVFYAIMMILVFGPIIYSFVVYSRIEGFGPKGAS